MTFRNFCLGSHCVRLCIVWPKLPKRNFTSSSLINHNSVHISQANQPLPIPSESCSICWPDKSEQPLQTCCNFTGVFVKVFSILHYKRDASIQSKGKIPVVTMGINMLSLPSTTMEHRKVKTRGRNGSENVKRNKAARTKLHFEPVNITPNHCWICASSPFPFNLSPQAPAEPCKLLTYFAMCTNSWS